MRATFGGVGEGICEALLEPDDAVVVAGLEFDSRNVEHLSRHGLDQNIVWDVLADAPIFVLDSKEHAATHLMTGRESTGRMWTVVIMLVDDELDWWRPITGWPSERLEVETWREGN